MNALIFFPRRNLASSSPAAFPRPEVSGFRLTRFFFLLFVINTCLLASPLGGEENPDEDWRQKNENLKERFEAPAAGNSGTLKAADSEKLKRQAANTFGSGHPWYASALNNHAAVLFRNSNWEEAENLWREALEIKTRVWGKDSPRRLIILLNLAKLKKTTGEYDEAAKFLTQAEAIRQANPELPKLQQAGVLYRQGEINQARGKYQTAIENMERALELAVAEIGGEAPLSLKISGRLGGLYRKTGQLDKAAKIIEQTYQAMKKMKKPGWQMGDILMARAVTLFSQKKLAGALESVQEAEKIYLKHLGEKHFKTANARANMAVIYFHSDQNEQARRYFDEAQKILTGLFPPEHPKLATLYNNLGEFNAARQKWKEAIQNYEKAEKIWAAKLPEDHPNLKLVRERLKEIRALPAAGAK